MRERFTSVWILCVLVLPSLACATPRSHWDESDDQYRERQMIDEAVSDALARQQMAELLGFVIGHALSGTWR